MACLLLVWAVGTVVVWQWALAVAPQHRVMRSVAPAAAPTMATTAEDGSASSTPASGGNATASPRRRARVFTFYYNWYGNPAVDGQWYHWDQAVLRPDGSAGAPHHPPASAGVSWWPAAGLYSSNDAAVLAAHCAAMRAAAIDCLVLSWYPPGMADQKADTMASFQDRNAAAVMDAAARAGLQVAFHIEPYAGRTPASVVRDMAYLETRYGGHAAALRWPGARGERMRE